MKKIITSHEEIKMEKNKVYGVPLKRSSKEESIEMNRNVVYGVTTERIH